MPENDWIKNFNTEMQTLIEDYVQKQDFHAVETPLKTDRQMKLELKDKLISDHNFESISHGIFNAINIIYEDLADSPHNEKVQQELRQAFKVLSEERAETTIEDLHGESSFWTAIYGISDETLLLIYELVLKHYKNNEIANAKDLLGFLLIFAPILPAYWNALAFCYQTEGNFDRALNYYLIAEQIDPEIMDTHFYLTRCYYAMNQKALALEQIEKIFKLIESQPESTRNQLRHQAEQLAFTIENRGV